MVSVSRLLDDFIEQIHYPITQLDNCFGIKTRDAVLIFRKEIKIEPRSDFWITARTPDGQLDMSWSGDSLMHVLEIIMKNGYEEFVIFDDESEITEWIKMVRL